MGQSNTISSLLSFIDLSARLCWAGLPNAETAMVLLFRFLSLAQAVNRECKTLINSEVGEGSIKSLIVNKKLNYLWGNK